MYRIQQFKDSNGSSSSSSSMPLQGVAVSTISCHHVPGHKLCVGPTTAQDSVIWGRSRRHAAMFDEDDHEVLSNPSAGRRWHVYGPHRSPSGRCDRITSAWLSGWQEAEQSGGGLPGWWHGDTDRPIFISPANIYHLTVGLHTWLSWVPLLLLKSQEYSRVKTQESRNTCFGYHSCRALSLWHLVFSILSIHLILYSPSCLSAPLFLS